MTMKEKIKSFVKDTLGCTCPEEVFRHIEHAENIPIQENLKVAHRIDVGVRLLIYVYKVERLTDVLEDIPELIQHGQRAKENGGYNRFRLVLVSDDKEGVAGVATKVFDTLEKEENIHLHVIGEEEFPA